ncbi:MAG: efflux RND transporter periplasmic adaptor subunit [Candidatus Acidiferrales bacterium]
MKHAAWAWVFAAAIALAVAGCGNSPGAPHPSAAPALEPAMASEAAPTPEAKAPPALDIFTVLSVEHAVDVNARRDGVVLQTEKDEGSHVVAGEELARLDDSMLQTELQKAESDLLVSENNVKYKQAESQAKNAQLHRQQLLRQYGLSSDADLEQVRFEAKAVTYEVQSWESIVQSNHAEIRRLHLEIDKTHIRAPFAGVVVRRYIRQGQQVVKDDKCFHISQLGPLEVEFQVPEVDGQQPEPGAEFRLTLGNGSAKTFSARVLRASPTVDPASDSYDVVARLTSTNLAALRPGMSVHVLWPAPAAKPQL